MFHKNVFYRSSYISILGRLLRDSSNKDIANIMEVIRNDKQLKRFFGHVTLISSTKNKPTYDIENNQVTTTKVFPYYKIKDRFYTNLSLKEVIDLLEYGSDDLKKEMTNIIHSYPRDLFQTMDRKWKIMNEKETLLEKFLNGSFVKTPQRKMVAYENTKDDVLFLDDMNDLEREIKESSDDRIFSQNVYDMYDMTVRLYIPYYLIDIIKGIKDIEIKGMTYSPIYSDRKLKIVTYRNDVRKNEILKYLSEKENNLYQIDRDQNILLLNTLYSCTITCSISSWNKICKCHVFEEGMNYPTISNLYYIILNNYPVIHQRLKYGLDEERLLTNLFVNSKPNK